MAVDIAGRTHLPVQETQETQVWSLGRKDPGVEVASHSNIPAGKIPWREEPWTIVHEAARIWHDWAHTHKDPIQGWEAVQRFGQTHGIRITKL